MSTPWETASSSLSRKGLEPDSITGDRYQWRQQNMTEKQEIIEYYYRGVSLPEKTGPEIEQVIRELKGEETSHG